MGVPFNNEHCYILLFEIDQVLPADDKHYAIYMTRKLTETYEKTCRSINFKKTRYPVGMGKSQIFRYTTILDGN